MNLYIPVPWLLPIHRDHVVKFLCAQDRCKFGLGLQQQIVVEHQRSSYPEVGLIPMLKN